MLQKPPHGSPCNGCGGCCAEQRCPLGAHVFGAGGGRPALEPVFPMLVCGLVNHSEIYAPKTVKEHGKEAVSKAAAILIGAGMGCDALLEGETPNNAWREWAFATVDRDAARSAAELWGIY